MRPVVANTYLIGAQKAGTTYLATLLDQSPDICVSDPKEPQFFSTRFDRGLDYYSKCFAVPDAPIRLDASTTYSALRPASDLTQDAAPGIAAPVPQRIAEACPEARLIYILRDPVARAASAHRHTLRKAATAPEGPVSLRQCIEDNPMLAISSRYADQIERYLEVFDRERFLFLDFRRLTRETEAVIAEVCAFLGADPSQIKTDVAEGSKNASYRMTSAGRVLRRGFEAFPGLAKRVKQLVPGGVRDRVADGMLRAPAEIVFNDQEAAAELFVRDRERVEALTGLRI